ncbi:hypothetical protein KR009_007726 [Drosophila setifemur]|nr:hypothetical protein KR009_007726 [Drosophila setifemur]
MEEQQATPPKKRRHSEYHDPDYHQATGQDQNDPLQQKRTKMEPQEEEEEKATLPPADKLQRIRELVCLEFQREIDQKVVQLVEIDRRLLQARHLLDRLRYQAVSKYYRNQQVPLSPADVANVRQPRDSLFGDVPDPQMPLHPAIKKIVGKRPIPIQNHLPERTAATVAKETIRLRNPALRRAERRRQQKIREEGIVTDHSKEKQDQPDQESPVSLTLEDDQPCTSRQAHERQLELNASRLNNKNKFIFVVGNTSKYIGLDSREDYMDGQALVYKWLVYVQGKDLPQPLESYVKKLRFHLHHSYRPNDIVDVHAPPFQLSRRGWGQFPMRIQLFFQPHLQQKPVQLMHTVVLDKTMCGLHTLGAETTVEIWLRAEQASNPSPAPPALLPEPTLPAPLSACLSSLESCKPRTISITQNKEELDDNLFAGINKIAHSDDIEHIEPTVLVSEPLKLSYSLKKQPPAPATQPRLQLRLNAAPVVVTRPSVVYLPVNGRSPRQDSVQEKEITSVRQGQERSSSPQRRWQESSPEHQQIRPVRNGHYHGKKNVVFLKAGKLYIIDPLQRKLKQAVKQQSLLKPQLSLLKPPSVKRWHLLQCIQHDHGYANMSSEMEMPVPSSSAKLLSTSLQTRSRKLEQVFSSMQFLTMRGAVEFLLRRLPLATIRLQEDEYPFTCATFEAFQKQSAMKQRCFEYLRARLLRRFLMQHYQLQILAARGKEPYWSLREIVGFARVHGYTPPLKMLTSSDGKDEELNQKLGAGEQLAHRVQEQLKEDRQPQLLAFSSLSSDNRLEAWIVQHTRRLLGYEKQVRDQEFLDVLGADTPHSQAFRDVRRLSGSLQLGNTRQLLCLPPPEYLDSATQLVQDMCKNINISLQPEESMGGVSQPMALTLLAHVLRTFAERLVRRSVAAKLQQEAVEQLPIAAANTPLCLQPHDIGRAISQCSELDFLENRQLGVAAVEPQT